MLRLRYHPLTDDLHAYQYTFLSPMIMINHEIEAYARVSFPPGMPVLEGGMDLMRRIFTEFAYDPSASTVDTPVDQVLANRGGVCQDFAHLAIACFSFSGAGCTLCQWLSGDLATARQT